ncbi:MAG: SH3 domain-containing protein [Clostridia bacterium]|nr:SH3 domain-containing protein [Clostridia bacterium]
MAGVADLTPGIRYYANVVVNENGLKVRKQPNTSSKVLGYWSNQRKAVVTGVSGNANWVECRWHGETGYVARNYLTNVMPINNIYDYEAVLRTVGEAEKLTGTHAVKYYATGYDSNSEWCHLFADWVVGHSIWDSPFLPNIDNCKEGVIEFLKEERFAFVNSWHKSDVWEHCSATSEWMESAVLDQFEQSYIPSAGDYVYFRKCSDQSGYASTETSYHVGIVVSYTANSAGCTIVALEGNSSGAEVVNGIGFITYAPSSGSEIAAGGRFHRNILGFGYACGLG